MVESQLLSRAAVSLWAFLLHASFSFLLTTYSSVVHEARQVLTPQFVTLEVANLISKPEGIFFRRWSVREAGGALRPMIGRSF